MMSLNPAEISKLIKAQIQSTDQDLEIEEMWYYPNSR